MQNQKWTNIRTHACKSIWDVLSCFEEQVGSLPGGQTTERLLKSTGDGILEYAESLLRDEEFCLRLPPLVDVCSKIMTREQAKGYLCDLLQECR